MSKRVRLLLIVSVLLALTAAEAAWIFNRNASLRAYKANMYSFSAGAVTESTEQLFAASMALMPEPAAEHIYSHRGSAGLYEHSFKAYDDAIASGSCYIEQDLVISSDGVLFVSHDLSAAGMTGRNALYSSMTAAEIDGLQTRAGGKVLRLSEVFDRYRKDVNYVIELKPYDLETINAFEDLVEQYGYEDVVTAQSMSTEPLGEIEKKYPDMPKIFVCKTQYDFNRCLELPYVDTISVRAAAGLMTEENCEAAHGRGKGFSVWTIDSEADIKRAIEIGADNYFTNDTGLAMRLETEYGYAERMRRSAESRKNEERE